jgi:hypothetical protein
MIMTRTTAHVYVPLCVLALVGAISMSLRQRHRIGLFQPRYWRWLLARWKIGTFVVSLLVFVIAGPYTGDCDWDWAVSIIMGSLTFTTAPWAVGVLWRRAGWREQYLAGCCWLLSASWSFDFYWFARRGFYPDSWFGNLIASSMLYFTAGLFWNLDWTRRSGWDLAFRETEWPPRRQPPPFERLVVPVIAVMAIMGTALLLPFFAARF